ncbi:hypothetical protein VTN96DRAFT_5083 [Rasamsonia emersonii]
MSSSSISRKIPSPRDWQKWTSSLLERYRISANKNSDRNLALVITSLLTSGLIGGSLLAVLRAAALDYRTYLSYGSGGLPYNLWGWFLSGVVLRPLGTDVLSTELYDRYPNKSSWLPEEWPLVRKREGPRPRLGSHPLPQRQLDQLARGKIHQKLIQSFAKLVDDNPSLIQFKPSVHEGHTESIFLADGVPASPIAEMMLREISHVHSTGDHSVHVVLAPQDCKKIIQSGWGQRHPLDGVKWPTKLIFGWSLPKEYILVYAPRTEEEVCLVMEIVRASVGFMSGSRDVV